MLASPQFCNSKRYPALLEYIVDKTLAGESDLLKERTLGVEVFDRPASYDTNADTVVRYTAGEVRKRLSLYYHELDRRPAIQISLPPGSYVPEFLHWQDSDDEGATTASLAHTVAPPREPASEWHETPAPLAPRSLETAVAGSWKATSRHRLLAGASVLVAMVFIAVGWRYHTIHARTALDDFWAPLVSERQAVPIYTGGVVFAQNNFSGVTTAGRDIDYPFVSMQSASAIAELSALLARSGGAGTQLQSAATTPLTELREHPVILLGGYNNQWTIRLLQPLRFHFSPESVAASIVDGIQPLVAWKRDQSLPYSSADDYALVARYRDATTDSWVVALAGVGRNGTEAAAQFVTSPHYMQMLRDRIGTDYANRNVEAVLKISVIDGKTGAPSILAVHLW